MRSLKYTNTDIIIKAVIITPKILEDGLSESSKLSILLIIDTILIRIIKPWALVSILYLFLCFYVCNII